MVKLIIALLAFLTVLASCGGFYPKEVPTYQIYTPVDKPWTCDPPQQHYRDRDIKAYCNRTVDGMQQYVWLKEDEYKRCRRKRHCHRH